MIKLKLNNNKKKTAENIQTPGDQTTHFSIVIKEISEEIKMFLEFNKNESTTY
jgi:hypothetical protein